MKSPLNRSTAPYVIRLFDYCFKQGVFDACELEDDYSAREFLNARLADGGYGLLLEPLDGFDWRRWQHSLYRFCRFCRLGGLAETYIDKVHRYKNTSVFAILPLSMRFYLMGIQEWLEYPNPTNTALFKQNNKVHWKPVPSHLRKIRTADFISIIQEFVYERQAKAFENDLTPMKYDSFANAMWRCVQKYPVYGAEEDEDI